MTFTDDDLKWLKELEDISSTPVEFQADAPILIITRPIFEALLARLEAAEKALKLYNTMDFRSDDPDDWGKIGDVIDAWRRSCGEKI
jgi:hypothetical protein